MKLNYVLAIVALMFLLILSCGIAYSQTYPQVFEVVEIDNDLVYLTDWDGNEWVWEGAEDWDVGDYAAAIMDSNGTDNIYDDIIIDLRYTRIAER